MQLHYRLYGDLQAAAKPPLMLLHGLLGSSSNWAGIAPRLAEQGHVCLVPDLRNHGRSPQDHHMNYPLMAGDLLRLLDDLELEQVIPIGHSMGAKAAMWLALSFADRVDRLVAVDMAPVRSPNRFEPIFDALLSLDLQRLSSRQQAEEHLAESLESPMLRQYLLQNLLPGDEQQGWRWRVNLRVLDAALEQILDFPQPDTVSAFQGDALFLYGAESNYVSTESAPSIQRLFPFARLRAVPGAGHWVYAEQPGAFLAALLNFLGQGAKPEPKIC